MDAGLRYDKRKDGAHGRAIPSDIPELGLQANDRLEPGGMLQYVGAFEDLATPFTATFWRTLNESDTKHRNPLFSAETGLNLMRHLTVDTLHSVNLGVMLVWCRTAVWAVIQAGIYGDIGGAEQRLQNTVLVMKHELHAFYKQWHKANPTGPKRTQLNNLAR